MRPGKGSGATRSLSRTDGAKRNPIRDPARDRPRERLHPTARAGTEARPSDHGPRQRALEQAQIGMVIDRTPRPAPAPPPGCRSVPARPRRPRPWTCHAPRETAARVGGYAHRHHAHDQRAAARAPGRALDHAARSAARAARPHRHQEGLRPRPVRRLHGAGERHPGEFLPDAGGDEGRCRDHHGRGARRPRRPEGQQRPPPDPGGVHRARRLPVRLLHARASSAPRSA